MLAGPTGVGKTRMSVLLAERLGGEIINYDSVQIYRGFDIGSAKPTIEERRGVPHHLLDFLEAGAEWNAADYAEQAAERCHEILARGCRPVLVGGTFFYLRALLSGLPPLPGKSPEIRERIGRIWQKPRGAMWLHRLLTRVDPVTASRLAPADRHRIERALEVYLVSGTPISSRPRPDPTRERFASVKFALNMPRERLKAILEERVEQMYRKGLVEETIALLKKYPAGAGPFDSIGYREAARVARGEQTIETAIEETKRRTRAYAKRQLTWLRSEPGVVWIDADQPAELAVEQMVRIVHSTAGVGTPP